MNDPLFSVRNLTTVFDVPGRPVVAVNDVSFDIAQGRNAGPGGGIGQRKIGHGILIVRLLQSAGPDC